MPKWHTYHINGCLYVELSNYYYFIIISLFPYFPLDILFNRDYYTN